MQNRKHQEVLDIYSDLDSHSFAEDHDILTDDQNFDPDEQSNSENHASGDLKRKSSKFWKGGINENYLTVTDPWSVSKDEIISKNNIEISEEHRSFIPIPEKRENPNSI